MPFSGRPHTNQGSKSSIILSSVAIGFRCFSTSCEGHTFADLRNLLTRVTGSKPSMQFYQEFDVTKYYPLWGGVTDVNRLDRLGLRNQRRAEQKAERRAERLGGRGPERQAARLTRNDKLRAQTALTAPSHAEVVQIGTDLRMFERSARWHSDTWEALESGELILTCQQIPPRGGWRSPTSATITSAPS